MSVQPAEYMYVAFKPCGCVVAFTADMAGFERETAKDVSGYIRSGFRVDRMSVDEWRERTDITLWPRCPHGANPRAKQMKLTEQAV